MNKPETSPRLTILIFVVIAMTVLAIQSCIDTPSGADYTDQQIVEFGHRRLVDTFTDPSTVEVLSEGVIRPGRNGGDFGYWARYRRRNSEGVWVEEDHYDE